MSFVQNGLVLGDEAEQLLSAPWAGILVALGARLARRATEALDQQLVVVITVPVRDYAAVLIAIGWTLARTPDQLAAPSEHLLRELAPGTPMRMTTATQVIVDRFHKLINAQDGARIQLGGSKWPITSARFLTPDRALSDERFGRTAVGEPGSFSIMSGAAETWPLRQSAPLAHAALVGTKSWLDAEMNAYIGWGNHSRPDEIRGILLPDGPHAGTWSTSVVSAQSSQELELPSGTEIAILDGASAVRWLAEVSAHVVVAIIDRNAQDTTAAESIAQLRSRGTPIDLTQLGWRTSRGIEALGFERPL